MQYTSTVTSKGQITIPAKIRKAMNIKTSDRLVFSKKDNKIEVKKIPDIDEAFGALHNPNVNPLSTEEMSKLIDEGLFSDKHGK